MGDLHQKWVNPVCWVASCHSYTTHVVESTAHRPEPLEDFRQSVGYCYWDAKEMALALVENYDNLYSIHNIRLVKEEDFNDDDELHNALLG